MISFFEPCKTHACKNKITPFSSFFRCRKHKGGCSDVHAVPTRYLFSIYLHIRMENKYRAGKVLYVEDVDIVSHKLHNTNPNPNPNHEKVIP